MEEYAVKPFNSVCLLKLWYTDIKVVMLIKLSSKKPYQKS